MYGRYRGLTLVLTIAMLFVMVPARAHAETDSTRGVSITFRSDAMGSGSITYTFPFSDVMFSRSAYHYNHDLARLSLGMAASAFNTRESDADWGKDGADQFDTSGRDANVRTALSALAFERIEAGNYEASLYDTDDKVAFTLASKHVENANESILVIAVIVRSGAYGGEWASNFHMGQYGSHHVGFMSAAEGVLQALGSYREGIRQQFPYATLKFWLTGYSRGAAVANLTAVALDREAAAGAEFQCEDVYAYTFATPQGAGPEAHADDPMYANIFNTINGADLVPMVALSKRMVISIPSRPMAVPAHATQC